jgi:hemolysin D
MNRRWLLNPVGAWQNHYQAMQRQLEDDLDRKNVGLPVTANWTKRLTQVILVGITAGLGWSIVARVDVVVNASGKLEPLSQSQVVQSRSGGIITAVLVREGQSVKQGQLLIQLEKTALRNQLQELLIQRNRLIKEVAVLRIAQQGKPLARLNQNKMEISPELMNQVQTRLLLIAQLTNDPSNLDAMQRQRYDLFQQQLRDRQSITQLQASGLATQVNAAETQIAQTQFQLQTEQELLDRIQPLVDEGAIPKVTLLQRKVSVNNLASQLTQNNLQKQQIQISQRQAQAETGKVLTDLRQDLQRQLAELDSKFDLTIKESQAQLIGINARLLQIKADLKRQDLRAPVDGIVFELETKLPGIVSQPGQTLLRVVPNEALTAKVQVANADIANIRVGMPVDVRVDAYPFTEYGAVKGVVSKIGREAVKVNPQNPQATAFPVEVRLDRQFLERKSQRLPLTPGMSLSTLVKVRQRAPISYVTEEITKAFDGIKSVR